MSAQQANDAESRKNSLQNPIRNVYTKKGDANGKFGAPVLLSPVSSDILTAAALLTEVDVLDAASKYRKGTLYKDYASYRKVSNLKKYRKSFRFSITIEMQINYILDGRNAASWYPTT